MKDKLEVKEEPEAKEEPKTKDEPVTPNNSARKNKRTRPNKVETEELPTKWPTQPQVVRLVTLKGEAVSKDKASKLKCNISLKCIPASDGSYIFKSDGGEGEFDDEDEEEEEEDDGKIEIPDLNGDGDEGDAPNNRENSKSDSKTEPDDEEDIDKEEHPKKKSHKDKREKHSSHNKKSKAEEEEEEEEEEPEEPKVPKVPFKQQLRKARYKKFLEDTDEANYVKGILLGLGPGVIPSQKQIDQSKLFLERSSDKTAPVADVSNAWMPILEDRLWLAVEAPDRIKHKDGTAPLYKYKDLLKLVPSAAGAWTAKNPKPALVAVIPPTTTTPLETAIGVEGLHTVATLCKVTIPKLPGDPGKKAKQYSFCGYCGVQIENF